MENISNNISKNKNKEYISIDEWIMRMNLAFTNGKLPAISPQLSGLGYPTQKLDDLLNQVKQLEQLQQQQKMKYAHQREKTATLDEKRKAIHQLYSNHLGICRIIFQDDVKAATALEFQGRRKQSYAGWFQQASNFYKQLLDTPEFLAEVERVNIQKADLEQLQNELEELSLLKQAQKKQKAEAQKATHTRNRFFKQLHKEYSKLISLAKVSLSNEQHLEAMGIVVKR